MIKLGEKKPFTPEDRILNALKDFHGHPKFLEIIAELIELHSVKNRQYAGKSDPLGNFRRGSNICYKTYGSFRDDPYRAQIAYALNLVSKQVDGVAEIVGESKEGTWDSLYEKLRDYAVYFAIMMVIEKLRTEEIESKKDKVVDGEWTACSTLDGNETYKVKSYETGKCDCKK
jgi:hypothetical protein